MKRLILLPLLLLTCIEALAVDVYIDLKNAVLSATPYTNRNIRVYPLSVPTISSPSVILGQYIPLTTDSNGVAWMSNSVFNLYQVQVLAPPRMEIFKFFLDPTNSTPVMSADTNLVADATATFPAGSVAYAAAVSDYRYAKNLPSGVSYIANSSGTGTNADFRWTLGAASQWIRLYKISSTDVSFEYQSGAIQQLFHTHNNELHYDAAPYFDYISDFSAVAIFDSLGRLQSQVTGLGALTNDDNGNLGWYPNYASLDAANHFTGVNLFSASQTFTGGFTAASDSQISANLRITGKITIGPSLATISSGSGSPENAVTAPVGSLYTRTDGGAGTTLYVKESGSGNTGWIPK